VGDDLFGSIEVHTDAVAVAGLDLEAFSAVNLLGVEHGVFPQERERLFHFLAVVSSSVKSLSGMLCTLLDLPWMKSLRFSTAR
jgi:hypothetical protein